MDNGCVYTIEVDGKKVTMSLLELTEHYYRTTDKLKRSQIYSSQEKQDATYKTINKFTTDTNKTALKNDSTKDSVLDYITKELPSETLEKIGLTDQERLNPKYIEENRVTNYITTNVQRGTETPIITDSPNLNKYMEWPILKNLPKDKVNYFLNEIEDIIKLEEKTKDLGKKFHTALQEVIRYNGDFSNSVVKKAIQTVYESNKDILGGEKSA